jgi:hypothetical protein
MRVSFIEAGFLWQEYPMGLNLPPADLTTSDR